MDCLLLIILVISYNFRILLNEGELVRGYLLSVIGRCFVFVCVCVCVCLWFPEAEARNASGQASLAKSAKWSFACRTELVLSAQRMFDAGLHLFLILTSRMRHETVSSLSPCSHVWYIEMNVSDLPSEQSFRARTADTALPRGTEQVLPPSQTCHMLSLKGEIKSTLSPRERRGKEGCASFPSFSVIYQSCSGKQRRSTCFPLGPRRLHFRFVYYTRWASQRGRCPQSQRACGKIPIGWVCLESFSTGGSLRGWCWGLDKLGAFLKALIDGPQFAWIGDIFAQSTCVYLEIFLGVRLGLMSRIFGPLCLLRSSLNQGEAADGWDLPPPERAWPGVQTEWVGAMFCN